MSSPQHIPTKPATSRFVTIVSGISALAGLRGYRHRRHLRRHPFLFEKIFVLSTFQEEIVVSAVLFGAVAGAAFGGKLADAFGRRKAVVIQVAILFIIGAIGTALAPTPTLLAIGRVIVGVAIGMAAFTAPLYISEVSPPASRGKLVSLN